MSNVIRVVQGDRLPVLLGQIRDRFTNDPVDLSANNTMITFKFRQAASETTLFQTTCAKVGTGATGQFAMYWPQASLNVDPGSYQGQVSVSFGGFIQTVYDWVRFLVREQFGVTTVNLSATTIMIIGGQLYQYNEDTGHWHLITLHGTDAVPVPEWGPGMVL